MNEPARGYKWKDFETGNGAAVKHGVWSSRRGELVRIEVDEIAVAVAAQYPWTASFLDERAAYARAVVDEQSIRDYLDSVGHLDETVRSDQRCGPWRGSRPAPTGAATRSA